MIHSYQYVNKTYHINTLIIDINTIIRLIYKKTSMSEYVFQIKLQARFHFPVNLAKLEHHFEPIAAKISVKY